MKNGLQIDNPLTIALAAYYRLTPATNFQKQSQGTSMHYY